MVPGQPSAGHRTGGVTHCCREASSSRRSAGRDGSRDPAAGRGGVAACSSRTYALRLSSIAVGRRLAALWERRGSTELGICSAHLDLRTRKAQIAHPPVRHQVARAVLVATHAYVDGVAADVDREGRVGLVVAQLDQVRNRRMYAPMHAPQLLQQRLACRRTAELVEALWVAPDGLGRVGAESAEPLGVHPEDRVGLTAASAARSRWRRRSSIRAFGRR